MHIKSLDILNFRNLENVHIRSNPQINIFHGLNGSGKTSLIEAIHYLSLGRSFRTKNIARLIQQEKLGFTLRSCLSNEQMTLSVGIERKRDASQLIRIGGKTATSAAELALLLPVQLLNAQCHLMLNSGPKPRRQFLDWGVFHVEHSFLSDWQRTNRLIKQRNASLKTAITYKEIEQWDAELLLNALRIDSYRKKYIEQLMPILKEMLNTLLQRDDCSLYYYSGWPASQSLLDLYANNFLRDSQLGYTQYGPQRADLQLKIKGIAAHEILSQGQLKLATYALRLSQGYLLNKITQKTCIYLIDDLPAELDPKKSLLVAELLLSLNAQLFITCIDINAIPAVAKRNSTMFHVEHGEIIQED